MVSHVHARTFLELFCAQRGIAPEEFERVVVGQALHPQAKALRNLLRMMPGDYFEADFEFVRNVGKLTRSSDFSWEVSDFHHHPANRNALRRRLKVRLSISRLRSLVMRTFAAETARGAIPSSNATTESRPETVINPPANGSALEYLKY